ncbi:MAG: ribonuclease P protein component [Thermodesulfobacteriota bacterium]|nr:ribonuclease P protein component [Thermodesulfobacteriota bacterium]
MESFSFPKAERLLKRADFVNQNRSGARQHTRHFVIILRQNGLGITRLGVTLSKKTGNAVKRNRVKRLIRELFRLNKSYIPKGYDIVVTAKKDASYLDLRKIKEEIGDAIFDKKFRVQI